MEELMQKILELKNSKSSIETEIRIFTANPKNSGTIFHCKWKWKNDMILSPLSDSRKNKHNANKLKLAKEYLKLVNEEIKENEQKLKKLLK